MCRLMGKIDLPKTPGTLTFYSDSPETPFNQLSK